MWHYIGPLIKSKHRQGWEVSAASCGAGCVVQYKKRQDQAFLKLTPRHREQTCLSEVSPPLSHGDKSNHTNACRMQRTLILTELHFEFRLRSKSCLNNSGNKECIFFKYNGENIKKHLTVHLNITHRFSDNIVQQAHCLLTVHLCQLSNLICSVCISYLDSQLDWQLASQLANQVDGYFVDPIREITVTLATKRLKTEIVQSVLETQMHAEGLLT